MSTNNKWSESAEMQTILLGYVYKHQRTVFSPVFPVVKHGLNWGLVGHFVRN